MNDDLRVLASKLDRRLHLFSIETEQVSRFIKNIASSTEQHLNLVEQCITNTERGGCKNEKTIKIKEERMNNNDLMRFTKEQNSNSLNGHFVSANTKLINSLSSGNQKQTDKSIMKKESYPFQDSSTDSNYRCRKIKLFARKLKNTKGRKVHK
mmetsp:Transcript_27570/g.34111  ORF Transcript_27570/g.34111 Transcript_27570/m.34111 type:complete len:153 (-) Transcript_27570:164-622(-)